MAISEKQAAKLAARDKEVFDTKSFIDELCATMCEVTDSNFPCICGDNPCSQDPWNGMDRRKAEKVLEIIRLFADDINTA
jgi:hypothetical protein